MILVVQFISGLASGPINPVINTIEYERIPQELRGRVIGAVIAGAYIAIPLGVLLAGYILEWVDVRLVLALLGGCYLLTIILGFLSPATRDMNARPHTASPQA